MTNSNYVEEEEEELNEGHRHDKSKLYGEEEEEEMTTCTRS